MIRTRIHWLCIIVSIIVRRYLNLVLAIFLRVAHKRFKYNEPRRQGAIGRWEALTNKLKKELGERGVTEAKWNLWRKSSRAHQLLNFLVSMKAADIWQDISQIMFAHTTVDACRGSLYFWSDVEDGGLLAFTTSRDIRASLQRAGYRFEDPAKNHPEAAWTYKQSGKDIVGHVIRLIEPYSTIHTFHFDGGGGRLTFTHLLEILSNTNPTTDAVTWGLTRAGATKYFQEIWINTDPFSNWWVETAEIQEEA